jgi:hypothetical protein
LKNQCGVTLTARDVAAVFALEHVIKVRGDTLTRLPTKLFTIYRGFERAAAVLQKLRAVKSHHRVQAQNSIWVIAGMKGLLEGAPKNRSVIVARRSGPQEQIDTGMTLINKAPVLVQRINDACVADFEIYQQKFTDTATETRTIIREETLLAK